MLVHEIFGRGRPARENDVINRASFLVAAEIKSTRRNIINQGLLKMSLQWLSGGASEVTGPTPCRENSDFTEFSRGLLQVVTQNGSVRSH